MGLFSSKPFVPTSRIPGQGFQILEVTEKLKITTSHLNKIYKQFRELDSDNSGVIDVSEFIVVNEITSEIFGELVFSLFDANKSGKLDFEEYMIAVWNYCTLHKDGLAEFAFDIFDVNSSGSLSVEEINEVIAIIWGYQKNDRLTKVLLSLNANKLTEISRLDFVEMSKHFPVLLFPIFEVQNKLRKRSLGDRVWTRLADKRRKDFGQQSVFEILGYETTHGHADDETMEYLIRRISSTAHTERIRSLSVHMKSKSTRTKNKKQKEKEEASILRNQKIRDEQPSKQKADASIRRVDDTSSTLKPPAIAIKPPHLKVTEAINNITLRNSARGEGEPLVILKKSPRVGVNDPSPRPHVSIHEPSSQQNTGRHSDGKQSDKVTSVKVSARSGIIAATPHYDERAPSNPGNLSPYMRSAPVGVLPSVLVDQHNGGKPINMPLPSPTTATSTINSARVVRDLDQNKIITPRSAANTPGKQQQQQFKGGGGGGSTASTPTKAVLGTPKSSRYHFNFMFTNATEEGLLTEGNLKIHTADAPLASPGPASARSGQGAFSARDGNRDQQRMELMKKQLSILPEESTTSVRYPVRAVVTDLSLSTNVNNINNAYIPTSSTPLNSQRVSKTFQVPVSARLDENSDNNPEQTTARRRHKPRGTHTGDQSQNNSSRIHSARSVQPTAGGEYSARYHEEVNVVYGNKSRPSPIRT